MSIDLPNGDIQQPVKEPLTNGVFSIGECKLSDSFQNQFDTLVADSKREKEKLQGDLKYTEEQKNTLRNIYCNLEKEVSELKSAIEKQTVQIHEVPGRNISALSIDGRNVDFLYENNGDLYLNFKAGRAEFKGYIRLLGFSARGNFREKLMKNGVDFNLYSGEYSPEEINFTITSKEGKELPVFSQESLIRYSEWGDYLSQLNKRAESILSEWPEKE